MGRLGLSGKGALLVLALAVATHALHGAPHAHVGARAERVGAHVHVEAGDVEAERVAEQRAEQSHCFC